MLIACLYGRYLVENEKIKEEEKRRQEEEDQAILRYAEVLLSIKPLTLR